jgi:hypothetical protein
MRGEGIVRTASGSAFFRVPAFWIGHEKILSSLVVRRLYRDASIASAQANDGRRATDGVFSVATFL